MTLLHKTGTRELHTIHLVYTQCSGPASRVLWCEIIHVYTCACVSLRVREKKREQDHTPRRRDTVLFDSTRCHFLTSRTSAVASLAGVLASARSAAVGRRGGYGGGQNSAGISADSRIVAGLDAVDSCV